MHKPSSWATGTKGTVGASAQTVATTKYSVHTAVQCPYNRYGERYVRITAKCDNAFTLYLYGSDSAFASGANAGAATGELIDTWTGLAATALDGTVVYGRIAGFKYFAPVLYQAGGDNATTTLTYQTFND
jgi:hypothetical protein